MAKLARKATGGWTPAKRSAASRKAWVTIRANRQRSAQAVIYKAGAKKAVGTTRVRANQRKNSKRKTSAPRY